MEIRILAVGRLARCAEADLLADYLDRAEKLGRGMGVPSVTVHEIDERKARDMATQAMLLKAALNGEMFWSLDERGEMLSSVQFSQILAKYRDQATGRLNFVIGGADGLAIDLRQEAQRSISFGKMVWPHMLVRVMLGEQIYRGLSILAGTPYHRV